MPKTNRIHLKDKGAYHVHPGRTSADFYDSVCPGLVLRVTSTGLRRYYIWYRNAARKVRWAQVRDPQETVPQPHAKTPDLADARKWAAIMLDAASEGREPGQERAAAQVSRAAAQALTFQVLGARFIAEYAKRPRTDGEPKKKSWSEDERIIRLRLAPLHDIPIEDLTRRDIRAIIDAMTARGKLVYANRIKSCVNKILNWAVQQDLLKSNPLGKVERNDEEARERVLKDAEIRTYWHWLDAPPAGADAKRHATWPLLAAWARLRLVLLVRSNEVLGMQWTDLEGVIDDGSAAFKAQRKRPVWLIPDTKNRRKHLVPLPKLALEILRAVHREQFATVHPWRDLQYVFAGILSARDRHNLFVGAGLENDEDGFQLRDARRTAATNMGKLDVLETLISRVLNHTTKRANRSNVTLVYNHWQYEPQKREALDQWAVALKRILSPLRLARRAS